MREICNICGIPEAKFEDGICRACGRSHCEMTADLLIEKRAYDYADKHRLLEYGSFNRTTIRWKLERFVRKKKVPKYFRDAAACDGLTFSSLEEFPCNQMYRVCRDSLDGSFLVGDLVWRSNLKPNMPDGINFLQDAGCLDGEICEKALKGAMFEISYTDIPQ